VPRPLTERRDVDDSEGKARIRRAMMRLVTQGKAVYDPETDRYAPRHVVDKEVARGEATYDPETGIYRKINARD
jgi:hypothetical protein